MANSPDYIELINPVPDGSSLDPVQVRVPTEQRVNVDLGNKIDKLPTGAAGDIIVSDSFGGISRSGMSLPAHGFMDLVPSAQAGKYAKFESPSGTGQVTFAQYGDTDITDLQLNKMAKAGSGHTGEMALIDVSGQVYAGGFPASQSDITTIQGDITSINNSITTLISDKMDKVSPSTAGNTVILDANGQVHDAGFAPVSQAALSGNYLPLAGGTMTGTIKLNTGAGIASATRPANIIYVGDNYASINVEEQAQASISNTVATANASGVLRRIKITQLIDDIANSIRYDVEAIDVATPDSRNALEAVNIHNVSTPIDKLDAANKKYVDDSILSSNTNVSGKADKVGAGNLNQIAIYDNTGNLAVSTVSQQNLLDMQVEIAQNTAMILGLQNLGHFLGTVATELDISSFVIPPSATINDFIRVDQDGGHSGLSTYYVLTQISPPIWQYGGTYNANITGKMDLVPTATRNNLAAFDINGQVFDIGYNPWDFLHAVTPYPANDVVALWDGGGQLKTGTTRLGDLVTSAMLTNEINSRQAADTILQNAINNISTATSNDITNILADISAEIAARIAGDNTIASDLNTEATTRANDDAQLLTDFQAHYNNTYVHVTPTEKNYWNHKADEVPIIDGNVAIGDGVWLQESNTPLASLVKSTMPTTLNSVAYYSTEAAAQAASVANPTLICFYPDP